MNNKTITIFGTSKAKEGEEVYQMAKELGFLLAEAGFTVANGGYKGTMLAAAEGAAKAEGKTIGVTCRAFGRGAANKCINEEIVTDSLDQRLKTLIELGDGYVVLPGSTGTLLELAKVWELKNKGFFEKDKPIILIGRFWKPLVELICSEDVRATGYLLEADSAKEAMDLLRGTGFGYE